MYVAKYWTAGEHHADREGLERPHPGEVEERPAGAGGGELGPQRGFGLAADGGRGAAGGGPRPEHADGQQQCDGDAHQPVALRGVSVGVRDGGGQRPGQQDGDTEEAHPPAEDAAAFVRVLGHLGGHGHVRHLEDGVRGGGEQEEDGDVAGRRGAPQRWRGEDQREERRQGAGAEQQERPAWAAAQPAAVGDGTDQRVDQDVPGLGQEDSGARDGGGHGEDVGEVVEQDQARHGREGARAERAEAVADPHGARQGRGRGMVRTGRWHGQILNDVHLFGKTRGPRDT